MRLVALLPVRNGERVLGGWLSAVGTIVDAVIALDDGSTDATRQILEEAGIVDTILSNPVRATYEGWDDRANRQRLLDAAIAAGADVVVWIDADERVAPSDGVHVRRLAEEAADGWAYGFSIHAATDDLSSIDPSGRWVYRLFRVAPGMELPDKQLHLVPIPTSIPRRRWLRSSIRLLHVGTTETEDLEARFAKYEEADPDRVWQESYDHLVIPPEQLVPVPAFDESAPLVLPVHHEADPDSPALSAIVISRGDEPGLEESVASVVGQDVPGGHEVIVVTSDSETAPERIRRAFPGVTVVALDEPALPGLARNAGLAVARGDFIAFPSSHIVLPGGALAARVVAHEEGWAMVTGTVINGTDTRAGWASYFLDHSSLLPDRPSGELDDAPTRCSYVRFLLDRVEGFPEDRRAGEDTVVNTELWRQGFSAYRERDAAAIHRSPCTTAGKLWRHHRARGRAWARILLERYGSRRTLVTRRFGMLTLYVPRRVRSVRRRVTRHGRSLVDQHRRARWLIVFGAVAAWWGLLVGIVRGNPSVGSATNSFDPAIADR